VKKPPEGFQSWSHVRAAYLTLAALMLTYMLNLIDRILPSIVAEPIKQDLNLTDVQLGLLTGIGFTAVYSILALPLAALADRGFRKWVISGSIAIWSVFTGFGGFATSFTHLLSSRVGVALGEAGSQPASYSMIASIFPKSQLGRAVAILGLGGGLATLFGRSGCAWIASELGWRALFMIMAPVGLLLAAGIALLVREPPLETKIKGASLLSTARYMARTPTLWLIVPKSDPYMRG
jgi:predicted MFS family arabinose efflux permease